MAQGHKPFPCLQEPVYLQPSYATDLALGVLHSASESLARLSNKAQSTQGVGRGQNAEATSTQLPP